MVTLGPKLKEWQEKDMENLRYQYDLLPSDIVLDLGSYRREFADEIKRRYGCHVECFEALDNRAAWTNDGYIEMGGQYYYTSHYERMGKTVKYACVDIAPHLRQEIALCKINIEGGEYELMKYILRKNLHKNVVNFQVQFHLVDGIDVDKEYKEIAANLSDTHELTWRVPFVWENWRRRA